VLAVTTVLTVVLAGCQPSGGSGGDSAGGQAAAGAQNPAAATTQNEPGCARSGPLTGVLLPDFGTGVYRSTDNPCIPYTDLVGEVTGLIPAGERTGTRLFLDQVGGLADRLGQVSDVAECAYSTDRLAVRIYQSRKDAWAVGMAAVVRGRVGAVAATARCYLIKQVPLLGLILNNGGEERDHLATRPCFSTGSATRDGQHYTLMWLGSSDHMCRDLQNAMVHGRGRLAAVDQDVTAALRSGPSTGDALVREVAPGTLGRVTCVVKGEPVDGDDVWARTDILGSTGYISAAHLDSGGVAVWGAMDRCEDSVTPAGTPYDSPDSPDSQPSDGGTLDTADGPSGS
jgi:hypothetical protein